MAKILPILVILLLTSLGLNVYFYQNQDKQEHEVVDVIDGDTFITKDFIRIRLLGLDAPEMKNCGGPEAKKELEKLILHQKITFDAVTENAYHRPVADVYRSDGTSVNIAMIQSGWAYFESSVSKVKDAAKKSGEESREAKRGVYSDECVQYVNTKNPKCSIKGNVNTSWRTKVYSFKGCYIKYDDTAVDLAQGDQWFCSEKEAREAGFTKAEKCYDFKFSP